MDSRPEAVPMKIFLVFSLLLQATSGRIFTKCELAQIFKNSELKGHPQSLASWVCLAENESSFNTEAKTTTKYGIFQIGSPLWCDDGSSNPGYSQCGISCSSLLDNNLTDDIKCAITVSLARPGMFMWPAWRKKCSKLDLSHFLDDCKL
ncbi:lysozyme C-1-like [Mustelus asterias]